MKDKRYHTVKVLIETGNITRFEEIFESIPKTVVALDFGTNYLRFAEMIKNVGKFKIEELIKLAELFELDPKIIIEMAWEQFATGKKISRKK